MKRADRFFRGSLGLVAVMLGFVGFPGEPLAQLDGHGPDAWRVVGVAQNDVLNARMGPGTDYAVIDHFARHARGLRQITCVPYLSAARYHSLSRAERDSLPARWCMMQSADFGKAGWVAARYLAEDALGPSAQPASNSTLRSPDDLIAKAEDLVGKLYRSYLASRRDGADNPLEAENADDYFFKSLVEKLRTHRVQANPLFSGQDFDVEITHIARDADQPMLQGTIRINVDFTNFGSPQRAVVYLRVDTTRQGIPPLRILAIEHDGWMF